MIVRPYGPSAWLIDDLVEPVAWAAGLQRVATDDIVEIVPTERTVLVTCAPGGLAAVRRLIDTVEPIPAAGAARRVVIDVRYDGADLDLVAERTGLTVPDVIARHAATRYTVAFCGFSPGFAYLRGLDPRLHLPRRSTPRTAVPAGAVAVAAGYSAVYPSASPGGWHLLGSTTAMIWDADRAEPALLTPGTTVEFRPLDDRTARRS